MTSGVDLGDQTLWSLNSDAIWQDSGDRFLVVDATRQTRRRRRPDPPEIIPGAGGARSYATGPQVVEGGREGFLEELLLQDRYSDR